MSPFNTMSRLTRLLSVLVAVVLAGTTFAGVAVGLTSTDVPSFAQLVSALA